jgi:hypothetical protein
MYSASAVERATEFCFFEAQDTRYLPRNWQVPDDDNEDKEDEQEIQDQRPPHPRVHQAIQSRALIPIESRLEGGE